MFLLRFLVRGVKQRNVNIFLTKLRTLLNYLKIKKKPVNDDNRSRYSKLNKLVKLSFKDDDDNRAGRIASDLEIARANSKISGS